MRLGLITVLIAFCCLSNFAQDNSIERDFEQNRAKLKLERFTEGEDASSGFYYLFYKNKSESVKVRQAWRTWAYNEHDTADYYFKDGKLVLYISYPRSKKQLKDAITGRPLLIQPTEKLYFTDSKLTTWIENNKTIATDDNRWQDKEKEILKSANEWTEYYKTLKKDNK